MTTPGRDAAREVAWRLRWWVISGESRPWFGVRASRWVRWRILKVGIARSARRSLR